MNRRLTLAIVLVVVMIAFAAVSNIAGPTLRSFATDPTNTPTYLPTADPGPTVTTAPFPATPTNYPTPWLHDRGNTPNATFWAATTTPYGGTPATEPPTPND
jgi:hypothetical protein